MLAFHRDFPSKTSLRIDIRIDDDQFGKLVSCRLVVICSPRIDGVVATNLGLLPERVIERSQH
jgi:hypothetical protein